MNYQLGSDFQRQFKELTLDQFKSPQEILERKEQNLQQMLAMMTDRQKEFWFQGREVRCIADLASVPYRYPKDILDEQVANPPFGIFSPGPIVNTSGGTTSGIRKRFPRSLDNYWKCLTGMMRTLQRNDCNETDIFSSTDTGGLFMAHAGFEDAAVFGFGMTRARSHEPILKHRLEFMADMGVTVLSATCTKLLRMSALTPKPRELFKTPLKLIIAPGEALVKEEEIIEGFGITRVSDSYGATEMSNIFWTCKHGHRHVNDDAHHIVTDENGVTSFTNLLCLPIFRYVLGETLRFSYKGQCECGSYLPTVDEFLINGIPRANKLD